MKIYLFSLALLHLASGQQQLSTEPPDLSVNVRVSTCENDPLLKGYTSINDINLDQSERLQGIENGTQSPDRTYLFPLCPGQSFNMTETPLQVLLSQSTFQCGSGEAHLNVD